VTPEIDGGNLLEQEFFPIEAGESEASFKRKVDQVAPRVLVAAIEKVRKGDSGQMQDVAAASYYKHRPRGIAACFPRRSSHSASEPERRVPRG
jgi:methionyl-tRNA formyltransferase